MVRVSAGQVAAVDGLVVGDPVPHRGQLVPEPEAQLRDDPARCLGAPQFAHAVAGGGDVLAGEVGPHAERVVVPVQHSTMCPSQMSSALEAVDLHQRLGP